MDDCREILYLTGIALAMIWLKKKYIYIGFSAWLLLIPLALTSSQKMMIKLKSNWKKLHRLIYVIAAFGILHFIWMSQTIFFEPVI